MVDYQVKFEEESHVANQPTSVLPPKGLAKFIIENSNGLITTKSQANKFMLLVILFCLGVIFLVNLFKYAEEAKIVAPSGREIEYSLDAPPKLK